MTTFQVPSLNSEGILSQKDAMAIYCHYLVTQRLDFFGKMTQPCKTKIVNAMIDCHDNNAKCGELVTQYMAEGKNVFFWSDQHFFHSNIIIYSHRPFETVIEMNDTMRQNYYNVIQPDDLVIFGGDISFAGIERTKEFLNDWPGNKVLVTGNHDFEKKGKFLDFKIFEETVMCFVFQLTVEDKICNVIVSHYPISNHLLPENTLNIHGHIHQYTADRKNINISVEAIQYAPQLMNETLIKVFNENYGKVKTCKII